MNLQIETTPTGFLKFSYLPTEDSDDARIPAIRLLYPSQINEVRQNQDNHVVIDVLGPNTPDYVIRPDEDNLFLNDDQYTGTSVLDLMTAFATHVVFNNQMFIIDVTPPRG